MLDWLNPDTWIISDTHLFHDNIIEYCNRPLNNFEVIIDNWNKMIQPSDFVFHMGDVFLTSFAKAKSVMLLLRGRKYFLKGNHDRVKVLKRLGFIHVNDEFVYRINGDIYPYENFVDDESGICLTFTHRPIPLRFIKSLNWGENKNFNVHGHIHNNESHYSKSPYHINMCVEVRDYRPWRLKEILEEIKC